MKPPSVGTLPATPELDVQVHLPTVVIQCQPDPIEDLPSTVSGIIKVPEQIGIRRNPEPTFAQRAKAAERSDGVRVQVN
jgi:hypothetical protein